MLYLTADRGVPVRGGKGASVHVRAVIAGLTAEGACCRLVTTRAGPEDGPAVEAEVSAVRSGPRLERLARGLSSRCSRDPKPLERALLRLTDNLSLYRAARRLAAAWRPDAVYERYALTGVAGSVLARRLGIPHLLEVNAPLAEEERRYRDLRLGAVARWLESRLLRRADRVLVVSEALAAHARALGAEPRKVLVLPNAVDGELFHPGCDGDSIRNRHGLGGRFVVGFTGTLKPWHGVHHLLRAAARAAAELPDLRVLIVGAGPERERLEGLASELGLAPRVTFTGHVEHATVGDHVAACDVMVAPYGPMEDHWFSPLKVSEYLATGRPVVASAIGQLAERLDADRGVVLVPPGDETALAGALVDLARDPVRRARLARAAATTRSWTWRALSRRVLAESAAVRREHLGRAT